MRKQKKGRNGGTNAETTGEETSKDAQEVVLYDSASFQGMLCFRGAEKTTELSVYVIQTKYLSGFLSCF